jgi:UPF0755 protein
VQSTVQRVRKTRPAKKFFSFVKILVLLFGATSIAGYYYFNSMLEPAVGIGKTAEIIVNVPKGANSDKIGNILAEQGLIKSLPVFRIYASYKGLDSRLQAGEYNLNTGMSVQVILAQLVKGETSAYRFTIPEGFTIKQITERLEQKKYVDKAKFMDLVARGDFNYSFLNGLPEGPNRLEGYLFPDTYQISKNTTEEQIINMMLARFAKETDKIGFAEGARKQGLTFHQAVILASIVEREAKRDEERPKVAAVFLNRLKKGWKMESCATIQYILGEPRERLYAADLKIDSPYNTYLYPGLPSGPIASPGGPSLAAAANPAAVDYMFFVVAEDGKHVFSRTLQEHNRYRAKYLDKLTSGQ